MREPCLPSAPPRRAGLWATGGALLTAVLSSACCWLPLLAVGFGASAAGLGAFFERWRVPFLLLTAAQLGVGFYFAYRAPRCAPGDACAAPAPRGRRLTRGTLWTSAALAAVLAFFPEHLGLGGGGAVAATGEAQHVQYQVQGLTCAGCERHTREAIGALPGVVGVEVSYRDGSARVAWRGAPDHAAVEVVVAALGYRVTPPN
jgi:copper chaperone CopZ